MSRSKNVLPEFLTVSSHVTRGRFGVASSTESYAELMERLRELDGSVLSAAEAQLVRDAADARLFGDADHLEAAGDALAVLDVLVEAARLSTRTRAVLGDLLCAIESVGTGSS
jgi:hypothetical protein